MRSRVIFALVFALALVIGFGAVNKTPLSALFSGSQQAIAASQVDAAATPAATPTSPTASIQAVVDRANQEQQDAFAQQNPSLMQDTATTDYYDQLVQTSQKMASGGVTAIKLLKLQWGAINLDSATTATATTTETWLTTYSDGTTEQNTDQNVYSLVLSQGTWRIQSDQLPDSSQSGGTAPSSIPSTGTAPAASPGSSSSTSSAASALPVSQTSLSNSWSGYSATSGTFTSVTGTWTVPLSDGSGSAGASATWVGIGGVNTHDLIQAGTQETSNGSGSVQYQAWVETLPQASKNVPFTVSPGDSVTVTIDEQDQSSDQWQISFVNNTTGETYQTSLQYASSGSSAEWIQEAPTGGRRLVPLDSFGIVQFAKALTTKDGTSLSIDQAGGTPITMVDSQSDPVASPTALTADGQGFVVTEDATST